MAAEQIDINQATTNELTKLPGIGSALAKRIVDYRQTTGPFTSVEDLKQVSGISDRKVKELRDLVLIGGQAGPYGERMPVGGLFETYRIEAHLAHSATSDVYRAVDVQHDRVVALKILRGAFARDGEVVKDLRWAMRGVAELAHPALVGLEKVEVTADDQVYLVMPYMEAVSLADLLETQRKNGSPLTTVESLFVMRQVVRALAAAHRAGLVHHNLTPRKILVREEDHHVYLLGLESPEMLQAQAADDQPEELRYLSPEQLGGQLLDNRSNIYSVGAMLYELLGGRQWPGSTAMRAEELNADATWDHLPEHAQHAVRTCLQAEPWARFQSAEELLLSIDRALLTEPQSAESAMGDAETRSAIGQEAAALETAGAVWRGPQRESDQRLWALFLAPVVLLVIVVLMFVRPGSGSPAEGDATEAQLLEGAVGQETLEALMTPQASQLTPTLSVLGNMLTARALAAPAVPGSAATPTFIPTPTNTPTNTPTSTPTNTPTPTPTDTPTPTPTNTRIPPTRTPTPAPTLTPTTVIVITETPPPPPPPDDDGGGGSPRPTEPPPPPPTDPPPPPPTPTPPSPGG